MGRIIINIWNPDITDQEALEAVLEVVKQGRIVEHYTLLTQIDNLTVSTHKKLKNTATDTFSVHR